MNRTCLAALVAAFALALVPAGAQAGSIIAYDNQVIPSYDTNQNFGNSLGLDFTVNSPITVTALGAYDSADPTQLAGVDGTSGVTVGIYNTSSDTLVSPQVTFSPTNPGTQINADAFLPIAPTTLGPGTYSVVAWNDKNYNSSGAYNVSSTENDGGGLISFTGGGDFGGGFGYPNNHDGGPSNRYDAGTFQFQAASSAVPEPASLTLLGLGAAGLMGLGMRRKARMTP